MQNTMKNELLGAIVLFGVCGCSTVYPSRTPANPEYRQDPVLARGERSAYHAFAASPAQDTLVISLEPATCELQNTRHTLIAQNKKASFWGGPLVMIAGALVAAAGSAIWVDSKNYPGSCAQDDPNCTSKDQGRGIAV